MVCILTNKTAFADIDLFCDGILHSVSQGSNLSMVSVISFPPEQADLPNIDLFTLSRSGHLASKVLTVSPSANPFNLGPPLLAAFNHWHHLLDTALLIKLSDHFFLQMPYSQETSSYLWQPTTYDSAEVLQLLKKHRNPTLRLLGSWQHQAVTVSVVAPNP
jgi:hypothetical protein